MQGAYTLDRNLVLIGVPTQQFQFPTLDGGQTTAPFDVDPNLTVTTLTVEPGVTATLANLTITGGTGQPSPLPAASIGAGGILNGGDLTLISCVITGNRALQNGSGGGILNANTGSVVLRGASVVSGNFADNEGGGIDNGGRVTVRESSRVSENIAGDFGGGIMNSGALTIDASTMNGNSTTFAGGAIYNRFNGTVTVQNTSIVSDNSTQFEAGGILNVGTLTVNSSTVSGNRASNGGGINNSGGVAILNSTTVTGNQADFGGGIYNGSGSVTLQSSLVTQNTAVATGGGGGIYNNGATVVLISSVVTANDPDNCFGVPGC